MKRRKQHQFYIPTTLEEYQRSLGPSKGDEEPRWWDALLIPFLIAIMIAIVVLVAFLATPPQ